VVTFFQNPDDLAVFVDRGLVNQAQARLLPGSGVDLERFQPALPMPGPDTFLFVGRLLGDKGVREFVEAARIVQSEVPEARFQLLGPIDEGNRSAVTKREVDHWVAEGTVDYLGAAEDVRPYIGRATAVVLPSYREGLPRSLLEAAAMARPLIASDVPGCRELVEPGVNGFLCEVRNASSLAKALKMIMKTSGEARSRMGEASRQMVERHYSQTVVISAYLDVLGKLGAPRS